MNTELQGNDDRVHSKQSLTLVVEIFEQDLKKYRELVDKDKDIFKTIKNHEEEFISMVDNLSIRAKEINSKINTPEDSEVQALNENRLSHYKIIFNHYSNFFEIQKKTAQTFLILEKNKEKKLVNLSEIREKYITPNVACETNEINKPQV